MESARSHRPCWPRFRQIAGASRRSPYCVDGRPHKEESRWIWIWPNWHRFWQFGAGISPRSRGPPRRPGVRFNTLNIITKIISEVQTEKELCKMLISLFFYDFYDEFSLYWISPQIQCSAPNAVLGVDVNFGAIEGQSGNCDHVSLLGCLQQLVVGITTLVVSISIWKMSDYNCNC